MRKAALIALIFIILTALCSCSVNIGKKEEETQTQPQTYYYTQTTQAPVTQQQTQEITQPPETEQDIQPEQQTQQQTQAYIEENTNTEVKTYYTDSPDNKYIVAVADRYGVDRACLVAFIRVNSSVPGANVLQFKGNRDSNGNLITTSEELVYVYDVLDNGTFRKTNKDGTDIDGYSGIPFSNIAAKATYKLTEERILPDIEKYKTDSRYRYNG